MPQGFTTSSDTQQWTDKMEKTIDHAEGQNIAHIASLSYFNANHCLALVFLCVCNKADANGRSNHRKTNLWVHWQTQHQMFFFTYGNVSRRFLFVLFVLVCLFFGKLNNPIYGTALQPS